MASSVLWTVHSVPAGVETGTKVGMSSQVLAGIPVRNPAESADRDVQREVEQDVSGGVCRCPNDTRRFPMAGIVQSLNAEWAHVARSPLARRALMRWATANPVLAEARSVDDFVDTRSCPEWGEAALRVLAVEAPEDTMAARTLLQALLGGLVCLCSRVGRSEPDAIGELVALAWARIRTYPAHRQGSVAANVLLDVRKQFVRDRLDTGTGSGDVVTVELPPDRPTADPAPEELVCDRIVVLEALRSARDAGIVNDSALATIIRTRVGGESLVEVAADMNLSPDAMWRRRTRAEQRLRALPVAA
jgi:hypothetical protein